jgi:hypothetical protein
MRELEEMRSSSEEQVKAVESLAGVYERILRSEREQKEKRERRKQRWVEPSHPRT